MQQRKLSRKKNKGLVNKGSWCRNGRKTQKPLPPREDQKTEEMKEQEEGRKCGNLNSPKQFTVQNSKIKGQAMGKNHTFDGLIVERRELCGEGIARASGRR